MGKEPVCYGQDYSAMTPQRRSQLRARLIKAGKPIPPGLESKRGPAPEATCPKPDRVPTTCTVIDGTGHQRIYQVRPNGEIVF